jgi:hypothetical protein
MKDESIESLRISKNSLIPVSLVSTLLMAAFWLSSFWVRLGQTETKVEHIEIKSSQRDDDLQKFEKEIIERLSRIEGKIRK